jgi:phage-related tail protein
MADEIKVAYQSLDEAATALRTLMERLDSHEMYAAKLLRSEGQTRASLGELTDEYNRLKTSLGRLIDGTRTALAETSAAFADADERAAAGLWQAAAG